MELRVVSLIVVAVGREVGFDAVSIGISVVTDIALADDTVVGLIGSTGLA